MQKERPKKKSSEQRQKQQQLSEFISAYDLLLLERQPPRKKAAFIDSLCNGNDNDRICKTCGQNHSFSPTFVDVKTSIDAIQKLCDSYASAFVITRRRRVMS